MESNQNISLTELEQLKSQKLAHITNRSPVRGAHEELMDEDTSNKDPCEIVGSSVGLTTQSMVSSLINETTQSAKGTPALGYTYTAWKESRVTQLLAELNRLSEKNLRNEKIIEDLQCQLTEKDDQIHQMNNEYCQSMKYATDHIVKLTDLNETAVKRMEQAEEDKRKMNDAVRRNNDTLVVLASQMAELENRVENLNEQ